MNRRNFLKKMMHGVAVAVASKAGVTVLGDDGESLTDFEEYIPTKLKVQDMNVEVITNGTSYSLAKGSLDGFPTTYGLFKDDYSVNE